MEMFSPPPTKNAGISIMTSLGYGDMRMLLMIPVAKVGLNHGFTSANVRTRSMMGKMRKKRRKVRIDVPVVPFSIELIKKARASIVNVYRVANERE